VPESVLTAALTLVTFPAYAAKCSADRCA